MQVMHGAATQASHVGWIPVSLLLSKAPVAAGFDVADAIALLRLDDLYVEVFEVKDVKVQLEPPCWSATSVQNNLHEPVLCSF